MISQSVMKMKYKKECHAQRSENLIYLRKQIAKMNLTDFSKEIGIVKTNLSDIEKGNRDLSISNLHSYKTYFREKHDLTISSDYLLGYTDMIENKSMDISHDLALSRDAIDTLKSINAYWNKDLISIVNYMLRDSGTFIDFIGSLSLYVNNEYTTPLYHDEKKHEFIDCSYHTPNGNGIWFGKPMLDNAGNPGWKMKGVPTSILESHAMLQMLDIINKWKREYKGE